jgi:hypothetical protein
MFTPAGPGYVAFCMLNPSTADQYQEDPTIRRCIGFAKAWGYNRLVIVNLFGWRATDPDAMKRKLEPIGDANDFHILMTANGADKFVCAWGNDGAHLRRSRKVLEMLDGKTIYHLGPLTNQGEPRHPLYLDGGLKPEVFLPVSAAPDKNLKTNCPRNHQPGAVEPNPHHRLDI